MALHILLQLHALSHACTLPSLMLLLIITVVQGVADGYTHGSASFFSMYRFDFMLDRQLRPYIMEVTLSSLGMLQQRHHHS